jgi:hypothetical protein
VSADLEIMRQEWELAYRNLVDAVRDPADEQHVRPQLDAITSELRRRIGGVFTLGVLAEEYGAADTWAREVLADQAAPDWPRTLTLVEGAAFHLYARGAVDYKP